MSVRMSRYARCAWINAQRSKARAAGSAKSRRAKLPQKRAPQSLDDLDGISGIGVKKREAYGAEVLRVCAAAN